MMKLNNHIFHGTTYHIVYENIFQEVT